MRVAITAAVFGAALVSSSVMMGSSAASGASEANTWPSAAVASRKLPVLPGFRQTASGPVLDVQRFTTVAALTLPTSRRPDEQSILDITLRVVVPTRVALSVRAWCETDRRPGAAPDARSLGDVLVIGQNPVPGTARAQVASRTLTGRAVVAVPAAGRVRCVAQISPRTEALTRSSLKLVGGTFSASPARVLARGAQRPAVLVGPPGDPAVREVAVTDVVPAAGAVRVEGEAELTTCALGYHLCGRGEAPTSVADVVLRLDDVAADGHVCRAWRGSTRRVTITPAVHHVKVAAPSLVVRARCGEQVRASVRVVHVGGNAVEVEPSLGLAGDPRRMQTHAWIQV